jgi:hypothetical protein
MDNLTELLNCGSEYKKMINIMKNNFFVNETIDNYIGDTVISLKYYKRDFLFEPFSRSTFTKHQISILKKYVKYCIKRTKQNYKFYNYIFSYVFIISKNIKIELLRISRDPQKEMRLRHYGNRCVIYDLYKYNNNYNPRILSNDIIKRCTDIWEYIKNPLIFGAIICIQIIINTRIYKRRSTNK